MQPSSNNKTIFVGGTGEDNFSSIQQAIHYAQTGDTIFVYSGEYFENIEIGKSLKLIGQDKNNTIIDGGLNNNVISVYNSHVVIKRFTIKNGNRGLYITSRENKIIGNIISNNIWRGAYVVESDNNIITNNEIKHNLFYGINLVESNNNILIGNKIYDNQIGSSIYMSHNNYISNNKVSENKIVGIEIHNSDKNICSDNYISNNEQYGLEILSDDDKFSSDNEFYNNNFSKNRLYNAYDNGINIWYNQEIKKGNYWDDYTNSFYYNIPPHKTKNIDRFPLNKEGKEKINKGYIKCFFIQKIQPILKLLIYDKSIFNS